MDGATKAKVLMVGPGLALKGGIASVVTGYLEAGIEKRCEEFCYIEATKGTSFAIKYISFISALIRFLRIIDNYDIVHLHVSKGGSLKRKSLFARIAAKHGKKIIAHEHSGEFKRDFDLGTRRHRKEILGFFELVDHVVVLSTEWREYFAEKICDPSKVTVLHNSVEVPRKACSPYFHQDILFLGRLDANKSPDLLLLAARKVLNLYPRTKLIFGGDGDLEKYRALSEELGIADRCEFFGWVVGEDRDLLFERSGVYCLPSKHEGMPMSVLEAMARGIPVIATPVGGVPQIIDNELNGLLVPVDDEEALSCALIRLISSAELRKQIGDAGRERVKEKFNLQKALGDLVTLYDNTMSLQNRGQRIL